MTENCAERSPNEAQGEGTRQVDEELLDQSVASEWEATRQLEYQWGECAVEQPIAALPQEIAPVHVPIAEPPLEVRVEHGQDGRPDPRGGNENPEPSSVGEPWMSHRAATYHEERRASRETNDASK